MNERHAMRVPVDCERSFIYQIFLFLLDHLLDHLRSSYLKGLKKANLHLFVQTYISILKENSLFYEDEK